MVLRSFDPGFAALRWLAPTRYRHQDLVRTRPATGKIGILTGLRMRWLLPGLLVALAACGCAGQRPDATFVPQDDPLFEYSMSPEVGTIGPRAVTCDDSDGGPVGRWGATVTNATDEEAMKTILDFAEDHGWTLHDDKPLNGQPIFDLFKNGYERGGQPDSKVEVISASIFLTKSGSIEVRLHSTFTAPSDSC